MEVEKYGQIENIKNLKLLKGRYYNIVELKVEKIYS